MNKFVISLMGAAATLAFAAPSLALSRANRVIVENYRDKIAAARTCALAASRAARFESISALDTKPRD